LIDFEEDNGFTVKVASSLEEFTNLLESGFEYVSDYEGLKICRKRKYIGGAVGECSDSLIAFPLSVIKR
jgi:hypothetical protein